MSKNFTSLFGAPLFSLFLSDGMVAGLASKDLPCSQDNLFSLVTMNGIWHCLKFEGQAIVLNHWLALQMNSFVYEIG